MEVAINSVFIFTSLHYIIAHSHSVTKNKYDIECEEHDYGGSGMWEWSLRSRSVQTGQCSKLLTGKVRLERLEHWLLTQLPQIVLKMELNKYTYKHAVYVPTPASTLPTYQQIELICRLIQHVLVFLHLPVSTPSHTPRSSQ